MKFGWTLLVCGILALGGLGCGNSEESSAAPDDASKLGTVKSEDGAEGKGGELSINPNFKGAPPAGEKAGGN
ncbi:MAG TPA: hypothetical protein PLO61_02235 [Fimbriimonadaceae bacterium]|nr:hypothetical protein [Fimbriimonadaceae bacterium]HRJ31926.1 hypothetical protein [Fimbriimonadaceae bacterium]